MGDKLASNGAFLCIRCVIGADRRNIREMKKKIYRKSVNNQDCPCPAVSWIIRVLLIMESSRKMGGDA